METKGGYHSSTLNSLNGRNHKTKPIVLPIDNSPLIVKEITIGAYKDKDKDESENKIKTKTQTKQR